MPQELLLLKPGEDSQPKDANIFDDFAWFCSR